MGDKSFIYLIPVLWKHKLLILGIVLVSAILTSIVMLLQSDYYQSTTIFYPVNSSMLEPSIQINEKAIDYYGDDHDVDRLLTMAHSSEIAQKIIEKFELSSHYKIDASHNKGKIKLIKRLNKLYTVQKTEFDAIELSVEDHSPEMAQKLVEGIILLIDQKAKNVVQSSQKTLLKNLKTTFDANSLKLNDISDSLQVLRKLHGIYNADSQAEALATLEINQPKNQALRRRIDSYSAGIAKVTNLISLQEELNEGLAQDALQIQQLESSLTNNPSSIHIIEAAAVPLEKSRPKRSLYVLGASILAGFFAMSLILIRENLRAFTSQ